MNHEIAILWRHRERARSLGRLFALVAKRIILLPALLSVLYGPTRLRLKGVRLGSFNVVNHLALHGRGGLIVIGSECSFGKCQLHHHADIVIGSRVVINDGVILLTASHDLQAADWGHRLGSIVIEDYAWIAVNAIILPGVRIGRGAVVGAGAVVRKDVPAYAVALGNPAIVKADRRGRDLNYAPVMMNAPFEAWLGSNASSMQDAKNV